MPIDKMKFTVQIFMILIVFSGLACTNSKDKRLFGKYVYSIDSGLLYSELILSSGNKYIFHSSSCLSSNSDTGSIFINEDTITFKSQNIERDKKSKQRTNSSRTLTGEKFIYQRDKLMYIRVDKYPRLRAVKDKPIFDTIINIDTLYWIKEIKIE